MGKVATGFFNYDRLALRYDPFPIGLAKPIVEEGSYREMVQRFPARELFHYLEKVGHKYSLSEKYNRSNYHDFIGSDPFWRELHGWVKSADFIAGVLDVLRDHQVDLGYRKPLPTARRRLQLLRDLWRGELSPKSARLSSRFEFSALPVDGGYVIPHTDNRAKIITLVVSMVEGNVWDQSVGGGTDVNRPKDPAKLFNELNRQADFDEMEVIDTFDFTPNQAVIFVKTFNSWHSVRPMRGQGSDALRKTLTINIEAGV